MSLELLQGAAISSGPEGLSPPIFEVRGPIKYIASTEINLAKPSALDEGLTYELTPKPPSFRGDNTVTC
jgi:hypothetical protein